MAATITAGSLRDLDELEQLYNEISDHLAEHINYCGWSRDVYPVRATAAAGLEAGTLYLARQDGRIAASVILNHEPEEAYHKTTWLTSGEERDVFVIHTLAVSPRYRNAGLGRALLEFAAALGRERGMTSIRLDVTEANLPAIRLYERCGYQYVDTVDLGLGCYGLPWFRLYELVL